MGLYKYPSMHELKDIAMIYNDGEWDNAKLVVWDPEYQREYNISFTGSSRPTENDFMYSIFYKQDLSDKTPTIKVEKSASVKRKMKKTITNFVNQFVEN